MNKPSFVEQFNKMTEAYISGKVNPYNACACFVGNLLNGTMEWVGGYHYIYHLYVSLPKAEASVALNSGGLYTVAEIIYLEQIFMTEVCKADRVSAHNWIDSITPEMEDILFDAFVITLDALKKLHESKGEVIEFTPLFKKREIICLQ